MTWTSSLSVFKRRVEVPAPSAEVPGDEVHDLVLTFFDVFFYY